MSDEQQVAALMRRAVLMLGHAAEDVEAGHYSARERRTLAEGLDHLSSALRGGEDPIVITGEVRS